MGKARFHQRGAASCKGEKLGSDRCESVLVGWQAPVGMVQVVTQSLGEDLVNTCNSRNTITV